MTCQEETVLKFSSNDDVLVTVCVMRV